MRRGSLQARLVALSFAAATAAIGSASTIILVHRWVDARERLAERLDTIARVVGSSCTAALTFGDTAAAREALASAAAVPGMLLAAAHLPDGSVFAEVRAPGAPPPAVPRERLRPGRAVSGRTAEALVPVELRGSTVGFVRLAASTVDADDEALRSTLLVAGASTVSLVAAFLLLRRLISRATQPLRELSALTEAVAARGDYALRATVPREEELAALATSFNQMLAAVQQRDAQLDAHRRSLEGEVQARTADLAASYARLQSELTRQRALREQLAHSQKMDAVGKLAGGVAHDFNNLLSVILTCAESLREDLPEGDPRQCAEEIRSAGQRAASLTRQLLAFSRKQTLRPQVLDVREVVADLARMIGRLIGEHIALEVHLAGSSGCVRMDPSQLEQVLVNLAVNARDAMPDGGTLAFEARDVDVGAADPFADGRIAPGRYVCLRVTDTGVGMDEATRSRIFEPFFTTKEKGKGTGLGLAIVYGIVQQSGGAIDVASAPGAGTTFSIHLPRVAAAHAAPREERREPPPGGGERILVVEDEPQVRRTLQRLLETAGYVVVEAANGTDALSTFAARRDEIDLVLTDLVMPGVGGLALGRALAEQSPVPVLYMSGYSEEIASGREEIPAQRFVQKPFDRTGLLERIAAALRAREPRGGGAGRLAAAGGAG